MRSKFLNVWNSSDVHTRVLKGFEVETAVPSALANMELHKCYELEKKKYGKENVLFITTAGMSNALSGFTDAQTHCPVIACSPYSDKFGGVDVYSSLRMPSGAAPLTVLSTGNAALTAANVNGSANPDNRKIKHS